MKGEGLLTMPRPLKPRVLLWADLSYADMEEVEAAQTTEELQRALGRALALQLSRPSDSILADMYLYAVLFCRERQFNREQTSVLVSIVRALHLANTETPLNNMEYCFNYFTELVLCHCVRRPPFSIDLFSPEQATQITEYLVNTYFRHYALYKYTFTPQVRLDLSLTYCGMPEAEAVDSDSLEPGPGTDEEKETATEVLESTAHDEEIKDTEVDHTGPTPWAELSQIVQRELSSEVRRVQTVLEQQLRESTQRLDSRLSSVETRRDKKK
ncbi:cilia- and flagella-associated protein 119 isoform X1 [Lepisosteus oculatus]|uniref:cilia- and flagella-associated protein 119 isoform X1 n=1 Tax=Lepisosteus oculatus TaxID=7918 RepID=UPI0037131780